jgi:hypothetical protein
MKPRPGRDLTPSMINIRIVVMEYGHQPRPGAYAEVDITPSAFAQMSVADVIERFVTPCGTAAVQRFKG